MIKMQPDSYWESIEGKEELKKREKEEMMEKFEELKLYISYAIEDIYNYSDDYDGIEDWLISIACAGYSIGYNDGYDGVEYNEPNYDNLQYVDIEEKCNNCGYSLIDGEIPRLYIRGEKFYNKDGNNICQKCYYDLTHEKEDN